MAVTYVSPRRRLHMRASTWNSMPLRLHACIVRSLPHRQSYTLNITVHHTYHQPCTSLCFHPSTPNHQPSYATPSYLTPPHHHTFILRHFFTHRMTAARGNTRQAPQQTTTPRWHSTTAGYSATGARQPLPTYTTPAPAAAGTCACTVQKRHGSRCLEAGA